MCFAMNYDGGFVRGYIFTDGSLCRHGVRDDARGGWTAVVTAAAANMVHGMYGPNPFAFPTEFLMISRSMYCNICAKSPSLKPVKHICWRRTG